MFLFYLLGSVKRFQLRLSVGPLHSLDFGMSLFLELEHDASGTCVEGGDGGLLLSLGALEEIF